MRQRQDARKKPERRMKTPRYPALPPGLRLLVLEDNTIFALDVEDMLLRNGAAQVEVVGTCEEALQQIDAATFDLALLDLRLAEGNSLPVAQRLPEQGVPFAFAVGYGERATVPPAFAGKLVIGTPYREASRSVPLATVP